MKIMVQTSATSVHHETAADKTRKLTKMALCVALLAISAYISFPLPFTPAMVTAATIIVNMAAFILKPNDAFLVILAWLLIGAAKQPLEEPCSCPSLAVDRALSAGALGSVELSDPKALPNTCFCGGGEC